MKPFLLAAWSLVMCDFRVRFRRTLLGSFWILLPLLTLVSIALLVGKDLGFYSEGQSKSYLVQLLVGLILWQLFTDTWLESMRLARRSKMILISVVLDPRIMLVAGAMSALIAFAIKLPVIIAVMVYFSVSISLTSSILPVAICILVSAGITMACFTLPLSLVLLDVRYAMPFLHYSLLLVTPIFYLSPTTGPVSFLNRYNPLSYLIPPFRDMVIGTTSDVSGIFPTVLLTLIFLGIGLRYFEAKIRLAVAYIGH